MPGRSVHPQKGKPRTRLGASPRPKHDVVVLRTPCSVRRLSTQSAPLSYRYRRWIQPLNATRSLNISAGVWKPSVLRGLWF